MKFFAIGFSGASLLLLALYGLSFLLAQLAPFSTRRVDEGLWMIQKRHTGSTQDVLVALDGNRGLVPGPVFHPLLKNGTNGLWYAPRITKNLEKSTLQPTALAFLAGDWSDQAEQLQKTWKIRRVIFLQPRKVNPDWSKVYEHITIVESDTRWRFTNKERKVLVGPHPDYPDWTLVKVPSSSATLQTPQMMEIIPLLLSESGLAESSTHIP